MHKPLKLRLWRIVDDAMSNALAARPQMQSGVWRIYTWSVGAPTPFIGVRHYEVAGGGFEFCYGVSFKSYPNQYTTPLETLPSTIVDGHFVASAAALGLPTSQVDVDLDWQTPSASLINSATVRAEARDTFDTLGVTETENHHLLSYGILEALGVTIAESEYNSVVSRFSERLSSFVDSELSRGAPRIQELAKSLLPPLPSAS